jgi:hypothetical protein
MRGIETIDESGNTAPLIVTVTPTDGRQETQPILELAGRTLLVGATVYLDQRNIGALSQQPDGNLGLQLPTALGAGFYDVSAVNPDGSFATFFNAYRVILPLVRARDQVSLPPSNPPGSEVDVQLPVSHPAGYMDLPVSLTLGASLQPGIVYTTLTVSPVPSAGLAAGTHLQMGGGPDPLQDLTLTAYASPGATTIQVSSFTSLELYAGPVPIASVNPAPLPASVLPGAQPVPIPASHAHGTVITQPLGDSCAPGSCRDSALTITGLSVTAVYSNQAFSFSVSAHNVATGATLALSGTPLVSTNSAVTFNPDGSLTVSVVAQAVADGVYSLLITNPDHTVTESAGTIVVQNAMQVTGSTPSAVRGAGDFTLMIAGDSLSSQAQVFLNQVRLPTPLFDSVHATLTTTILSTIPSGIYLVTVVNPDASRSSAPLPIQIARTPEILGFSPTLVVGTQDFTLSIAGGAFDPSSSVLINGTAFATVLNQDGTLSATLHGLASGDDQVAVQTPAGVVVVAARTLHIQAGPQITAFSPTTIFGQQTFTLHVAGDDFAAGAQLAIDGQRLTTTPQP